ncbi:MAG: magnesium transporter CorA family protein [Bacteroidales bacterium]|nr:magnesium transporter CorA family protein [Bacteroidales bacterium]HNW73662.1 magnesium transporter CorA family protein [Bacteroidales bacterium]HPS49848.1 magnesium transporter CorA family protein [Bacteroidales bacterium]
MIETIKFGTLRWSHITRPTEEDLQALKARYHFHHLDLEDCRTEVNLRPKIDIYDDYYFVILHFPAFGVTEQFIETREIKFFWGKDYLISLGKSQWLLKELFNREKAKSQATGRMEVGSSDALFYQILDHLTKDTQRLVEQVDKNVDDCGKAIFGKKAEQLIEKISKTRKNVILLNTMFKPQIVLFNKLQSGAIKGFADDMEDYWGNIMDYYQKIWDMVEDDGELIKGYSMTFDSLQVNKTNEVMKILTLVSSILLPLTFIASLYGMNIKLPVQDHPFSFYIVSGSMALLAILMVIFFKIKKWM